MTRSASTDEEYHALAVELSVSITRKNPEPRRRQSPTGFHNDQAWFRIRAAFRRAVCATHKDLQARVFVMAGSLDTDPLPAAERPRFSREPFPDPRSAVL